MAELLARYIREECPQHKGADVEKYTLQGFLDDSQWLLAAKLEKRKSAIDRGESHPSSASAAFRGSDSNGSTNPSR